MAPRAGFEPGNPSGSQFVTAPLAGCGDEEGCLREVRALAAWRQLMIAASHRRDRYASNRLQEPTRSDQETYSWSQIPRVAHCPMLQARFRPHLGHAAVEA